MQRFIPFPPLRRLVLAACVLGAAWPQAQAQTRHPGHFTGVALAMPAQVTVATGAKEAVTIDSDARTQARIATVVEGGVLYIRPVRRNDRFDGAPVRVNVQAREITRLSVAGSGKLEAQPFKASSLSAEVGGAGSIQLNAVELGMLSATVGGSGNLQVNSGTVRRAEIGIGGSGEVRMEGARIVHATVNVAGSGNTTLNVREALKATIAGSGNVDYYGDPQVSRTIAGSGEVRRLGPGR